MIDSLTLEDPTDEEPTSSFDVELSDNDFEAAMISDAQLQVIYYVSGYCGHRVKKTVACSDCVSVFVSDNTMPNTGCPKSKNFFHLLVMHFVIT